MTADRILPTTRRRALLALASLTALSLTACSGGGDAEFEEDGGAGNGAADGDAGKDAADQEPSTASDGGVAEQASGDQPSTSSVDPAEAIATLEYPLPSDEIEGTMTVGLHHLRRRGEALELLLTYTPEFSDPGAHSLWDLHDGDFTVTAPALVDRANLTRYDILHANWGWDTEAVWSSKQAAIDLASGQTQAYWANFAAPIDDIEVIDVLMGAGPAFEDVTIEAEEG